MAKAVVVQLTFIGEDAGPDFFFSCPTGTVTPSGATKNELLTGTTVTIDDDNATELWVTSIGGCDNTLEMTISSKILPPNPTIIEINNIYAHIRWDEVYGADYYQLERATQSDYSDSVLIYEAAGIEHFDTKMLENQETYYYRIKTICEPSRIINSFESGKGTIRQDSDWFNFQATYGVNDPIITTMIADREVKTVSVSGTSVTSNVPFTINDVDKIIVIKDARLHTVYRPTPIAYHGFILSVDINGVATIGSKTSTGGKRMGDLTSQLTDCVGVTAYIGTNNFDALKSDINNAIINDKNAVQLSSGNYLINFFLSEYYADTYKPSIQNYPGSPTPLSLYINDTRTVGNDHFKIVGSGTTLLHFVHEELWGQPDETDYPGDNIINSFLKVRTDKYKFIIFQLYKGTLGLFDLKVDGQTSIVNMPEGGSYNWSQFFATDESSFERKRLFVKNFILSENNWRGGFTYGFGLRGAIGNAHKDVYSFVDCELYSKETISANSYTLYVPISNTIGRRLILNDTKFIGSSRQVKYQVSVTLQDLGGGKTKILFNDPTISPFDNLSGWSIPIVKVNYNDTIYTLPIPTPVVTADNPLYDIDGDGFVMYTSQIPIGLPTTGTYDAVTSYAGEPDALFVGFPLYIMSKNEFTILRCHFEKVYKVLFLRMQSADPPIYGSHSTFGISEYTFTPITGSTNEFPEWVGHWSTPNFLSEYNTYATYFAQNGFDMRKRAVFRENQEFSTNDGEYHPAFIVNSICNGYIDSIDTNATTVIKNTYGNFRYYKSGSGTTYVDNTLLSKTVDRGVILSFNNNDGRMFVRGGLNALIFSSNTTPRAGCRYLYMENGEFGRGSIEFESSVQDNINGGWLLENWMNGVDNFSGYFKNMIFTDGKQITNQITPIVNNTTAIDYSLAFNNFNNKIIFSGVTAEPQAKDYLQYHNGGIYYGMYIKLANI